MKWWPTILFCVGVFFFMANYAPKEKNDYEILGDGCLIYSIHYKNSLLAQEMLGGDMWARVLAMHFYSGLGHAVTVFVYEKRTYVYDPNRGSFLVSKQPLYDPLTIAEIAFPKIPIRKAYYLEPTLLLHQRYEKKEDVFKINP
jgi:hypothetical protein